MINSVLTIYTVTANQPTTSVNGRNETTSFFTAFTTIGSDATYIYAPSIEVRWKPTNRNIISLLGLNETQVQGNQSSQHKPSPSLKGGQIAGIVIGSILFVTTVCAIVFFLLRRRSQRRKPMNPENDQNKKETQAWEKVELDGKAVPFAELAGTKDPEELPPEPLPPVELPDNEVQHVADESVPNPTDSPRTG